MDFFFFYLLNKLLNSIKVAAALAEPPPRPAPNRNLFVNEDIKFLSQFVNNLNFFTVFKIRLSLGFIMNELFFFF